MTESDSKMVFDRKKVKRARLRQRALSLDHHRNIIAESDLIAFYFDGKKDKTKIPDGHNFKITTEEHISILQEPGSLYIDHATPTSSDADAIVEAVRNSFAEASISMDKLCAIGCDGTAVNTGIRNGVVRKFEMRLQRPLQWIVCLLHANELPLRHMIRELDGTTKSPNAFSGPIGSQLPEWRGKPIVRFQRIDFVCPENINLADFNSDQLYLLEMCKAISNGNCPQELAERSPGKLSHSRWTTAGNLLLRLYVSTRNPSKNLKLLTEYVIKVYAPMIFNIKYKPSVTQGAIHFTELVKLSRCMPNNVLHIIDPVIKRNAFFAHSENVILAMLDDDRQFIRELALHRIIQARAQRSTTMRIFAVPGLNFNATDYVDIIDWGASPTHEPPLLKSIEISNDNVMELAKKKFSDADFGKQIAKIPCHSQAVERCVKLVSETSMSVIGKENRNGVILNTLNSRRNMPAFKSKQDFKANIPIYNPKV